jgi:hypothetical protein
MLQLKIVTSIYKYFLWHNYTGERQCTWLIEDLTCYHLYSVRESALYAIVSIGMLVRNLQHIGLSRIRFTDYRRAFQVSVIWTLDRNFKVLDTWFGKTIIRSACEMEYEQAQALLNGAEAVEGLDKKLAQRLKRSVVKLVDILRVIRVGFIPSYCWFISLCHSIT